MPAIVSALAPLPPALQRADEAFRRSLAAHQAERDGRAQATRALAGLDALPVLTAADLQGVDVPGLMAWLARWLHWPDTALAEAVGNSMGRVAARPVKGLSDTPDLIASQNLTEHDAWAHVAVGGPAPLPTKDNWFALAQWRRDVWGAWLSEATGEPLGATHLNGETANDPGLMGPLETFERGLWEALTGPADAQLAPFRVAWGAAALQAQRLALASDLLESFEDVAMALLIAGPENEGTAFECACAEKEWRARNNLNQAWFSPPTQGSHVDESGTLWLSLAPWLSATHVHPRLVAFLLDRGVPLAAPPLLEGRQHWMAWVGRRDTFEQLLVRDDALAAHLPWQERRRVFSALGPVFWDGLLGGVGGAPRVDWMLEHVRKRWQSWPEPEQAEAVSLWRCQAVAGFDAEGREIDSHRRALEIFSVTDHAVMEWAFPDKPTPDAGETHPLPAWWWNGRPLTFYEGMLLTVLTCNSRNNPAQEHVLQRARNKTEATPRLRALSWLHLLATVDESMVHHLRPWEEDSAFRDALSVALEDRIWWNTPIATALNRAMASLESEQPLLSNGCIDVMRAFLPELTVLIQEENPRSVAWLLREWRERPFPGDEDEVRRDAEALLSLWGGSLPLSCGDALEPMTAKLEALRQTLDGEFPPDQDQESWADWGERKPFLKAAWARTRLERQWHNGSSTQRRSRL